MPLFHNSLTKAVDRGRRQTDRLAFCKALLISLFCSRLKNEEKNASFALFWSVYYK